MHERRIDQMFAEEPDLEFIGAQHIADGEIVGAIVSYCVGTASQGAAMADDDLMSVEQARDLHRHFFPAPRRTLNARVSATSAAMAIETPPRS